MVKKRMLIHALYASSAIPLRKYSSADIAIVLSVRLRMARITETIVLSACSHDM